MMLADTYLPAKALHVAAVIAWMAALLMLPRLYVYQTGAEPGGELDRKMIEAARRLRTFVLNPAMIATWLIGLYILFFANPALISQGWMHIKLMLVVLLSGLHGWYVAEGRKLARGERKHSERFWRLLNEVPFVFALVIVFLAILKPSF